MRWIKITMRDKHEFLFPEYKVIAVLDSEDQMVRVHNKKGEWTGTTINKADISYTEYDHEKTIREEEKEKRKLLAEGMKELCEKN